MVSAPSQSQSTIWSIPPCPHFKINFDALVSNINQVIGIGVVIGTYSGHFITGLSKKLKGPSDVQFVEALASRGAISLAKVLVIPSFILEGDASSIIKLFYNSEDILSNTGPVIEHVRCILLDQNAMDVTWIPRESNMAARNLAHYAKMSNHFESLWNFFPTFVKQLLLDESQ